MIALYLCLGIKQKKLHIYSIIPLCLNKMLNFGLMNNNTGHNFSVLFYYLFAYCSVSSMIFLPYPFPRRFFLTTTKICIYIHHRQSSYTYVFSIIWSTSDCHTKMHIEYQTYVHKAVSNQNSLCSCLKCSSTIKPLYDRINMWSLLN